MTVREPTPEYRLQEPTLVDDIKKIIPFFNLISKKYINPLLTLWPYSSLTDTGRSWSFLLFKQQKHLLMRLTSTNKTETNLRIISHDTSNGSDKKQSKGSKSLSLRVKMLLILGLPLMVSLLIITQILYYNI